MAQEYTILVLGAGGVGKSSLTIRMINGRFCEKYDPTIEDFYTKSFTLDGEDCLLNVIDTAGPEEYSSFRDTNINTAHGFLIVYSTISETSFLYASRSRTKVLREKQVDNIPIVLVGNKCDLETERKISKNEALNLSTQFQCQLFETSAKDNINVEECFFELVRKIKIHRNASDPVEPSKCNIL